MTRFQEEKDGEIRCGLGVLFPKVFSKVKGYLAKEATSRGPATYQFMDLLVINISPQNNL